MSLGATRGPVTHARVATATATRDLVHAVVAADADDETLRAVGALVAQANALLAAVPQLPRTVPDFREVVRRRAENVPEVGDSISPTAERAVTGIANPAAVEITSRVVEGAVEADVCFRAAFEGAPGRVHGGILAAVLDDLVGTAMAQAGSLGFTGRLTVSYRAPVPIDRTLRFRAWPGARDGRKQQVHADVQLDGRSLATADALMILVEVEHFATHVDDLPDRAPANATTSEAANP